MGFSRIRREKSDSYTTVCNTILRDRNLTLKAKGLFTTVMALPDSWDFSIEGLVKIVHEKKHAVYSAIQELRKHGYCQAIQVRNEKGIIQGTDYLFTEKPHPNYPDTENQDMDETPVNNPYPNYPDTDYPDTENQPQIKKQRNKKTKKKENTVSEADEFTLKLREFQSAYAEPTTKELIIANHQAVTKLKSTSEGDWRLCIRVHELQQAEAWRNGVVDWTTVFKRFNFYKLKAGVTKQDNYCPVCESSPYRGRMSLRPGELYDEATQKVVPCECQNET